MVDQIFTPPQIADDLLKFVSMEKCEVICDTAAGGGALLQSASNKYKTSRLIGFDSDIKCVSILKQLGFESGRRDVLSRHSKASSKLGKEISGTVDMALLNPPFSSVGCKHFVYSTGNLDLKVTLPMYFLIDSFSFLRPGGTIACVLPSGMVDRKADQSVWRMLEKFGTVTFSTPRNYHGWRCKISTVFAKIRKASEFDPSSEHKLEPHQEECGFEIVRGRLKNSKKLKVHIGGVPFVHSTELVDGEVEFGRLIDARGSKMCCGPSVLVPRVGNPNISKICVLEKNNSVVLSDCVISIQTGTTLRAHEIRKIILNEWDSFQFLYKGTCARHITVQRLQEFLREFVR